MEMCGRLRMFLLLFLCGQFDETRNFSVLGGMLFRSSRPAIETVNRNGGS